jgi:hypothetical protein
MFLETDKGKLLEKEYSQINDYNRSFLSTLVSWYAFFCTINGSAFIGGIIAYSYSLSSNVAKCIHAISAQNMELIIKTGIKLFMFFNFLALILTVIVGISYFQTSKRMYRIIEIFNNEIGSNNYTEMPFTKYFFWALTILMALSIIGIFTLWLFTYLEFD